MNPDPEPRPESHRFFTGEGAGTIEDYYPVFDERTPRSRSRRHFRVKETFNDRRDESSRAIVSTSLYFGTNQPGDYTEVTPTLAALRKPSDFVKRSKAWWDVYFQPFLDGCRRELPAGFVHRVYLAANLDFLVPLIPGHVEIYLMESNSWGPTPGAFWRYLPLKDSIMCIARDADRFALEPDYVHLIEFAIATRVRLVRRIQNRIIGKDGRFGYRSIRGTFAARGPLPIEAGASAWFDREPIGAEVPGYPELHHWGLAGPNDYGTDEQFLCRWLYYRMATHPTIALLRPHSDLTIFRKDFAYLEAHGARHTAIRLPRSLA